jgi:hypothetical protein
MKHTPLTPSLFGSRLPPLRAGSKRYWNPVKNYHFKGNRQAKSRLTYYQLSRKKPKKQGVLPFPSFPRSFRAHPKDAGFPEKFQWITLE